MQRSVQVGDLYESLKDRLNLTLCAGEAGLSHALLDVDLPDASYIIAGPLTFIRPTRIQIIGKAEIEYLDDPKRDRSEALDLLFRDYTRAVVLVDGVSPDNDLGSRANQAGIPLLCSPLPDKVVLDHLLQFATLHLTEKTTLHGVFLEVLGMGVLITGDPAVGKSELALELITRGNRLVADDAPEFNRIGPGIINGACPFVLRDLLEVRGLGVLNIRAMFGDNAIKHNKYLRLIVHLKRMNAQQLEKMERLSVERQTRSILGEEMPQVTIPVAPGRNLAILVESAVRNHLLKLQGYDATEVLIERQQALLSGDP